MIDPLPSDDEASLVRRAQAGDQDALAELLHLWQPALEGIARSLHRRHARLGFDTHDLVATTLRRLLHIEPGRVHENSGRSLLHRILRNVYADKVRSEIRSRRRQADALKMAPSQSPPTPALEELPEGMSPDEWELVLLWKQGLSWAQIGAHLGLPAESARKRWHRLIRRLKDPQSPDEKASASDSANEDLPGEDPPSDRAADPDLPPGPAV